MNRASQSPPAAEPFTAGAELHVESGQFSTSHRDMVCALFGPIHYEARYAYPLIVWLHGPGDDERQLLRVMPVVSLRNYVAVAPRGLLSAPDARRGGYGWDQDPEHIQQAEQRVFDAVDAAARAFHVARRRVFLAGFDCGGTMALRVAMRRPKRFAGVASLCGRFPTGGTPLSELPGVRSLPVFLAAGRRSLEYPTVEVCDNLRLLHSAGVSLSLREYPCGHEVSELMLHDLNRWIMEEVAGTPSPAVLPEDSSR
jgi:phospholipase/carboxylesterase